MTKKHQKSKKGDIHNTTYNIKNVGAVGGSGNNQQVSSKVIVNPAIEKKIIIQKKWYQQWMFFVIVIASISGLIAGFYFNSLLAAGIGFVLTALAVNVFNPKRRFLYTAYFTLSVAGVSSLLKVSGKFTINGEIMGSKYDILFKLGEAVNPWSITILVALSAWLFWLDHKQK
ncbi:MAG: hypothetical protein JKY19_16130 [Alcanivoracaceae bacterium]|nr:hypothetical protein [Alcanivoracaceae bacterium]